MKKKTLEIIVFILTILLVISLQYKMKQRINIDCDDLGMATMFVSVDATDILEVIEKEYGLKKVEEISDYPPFDINYPKSTIFHMECCYPSECEIPCEYNNPNCIYPIKCGTLEELGLE